MIIFSSLLITNQITVFTAFIKSIDVIMKQFYIYNTAETDCGKASGFQSSINWAGTKAIIIQVELFSVTLPGLACNKGLNSNANHKDDE